MSNATEALHRRLTQLSESLLAHLSTTPYAPPEGSAVSVKFVLQSLLRNPSSGAGESQLQESIRNFVLASALLSASESSTHELLSWIPRQLAAAAAASFRDLSDVYCHGNDKRLVAELAPEVLLLLKDRIKESSIDKGTDGDEVSAASARVPVGFAILAAYQLRWFVTQIDKLNLGKLCNLVIPCALTALDHWSTEVKGQGMICFIHLGKNVNSAEFGVYQDVILDACCNNIASADEIWHLVVEMSVLLVSSIHQSNPRSHWYERILGEMLSHLERQPRNKERRVAWLTFIEPLFQSMGLVLLAHFRRLFPLFFKWIHADDDETVLLVLKRVHTVLKLTWIRNTPYIMRLVDELVALHKEAALRVCREEIRTSILEVLLLLKQCKGQQFTAAWEKHRDDSNLAALCLSLTEISIDEESSTSNTLRSDSPQNCLQLLTTH
ncbi:unnamed protein product [Linum tenue]|uniref:Uncharacterized protein n=1 Tax=Linum tenue TaxID=586396 RepID=A0AAV0JM77_9ROSI|nr:unnamed protein product [Linum tenue]